MMDVIDCLPPGLHEMVISPRPADVPAGGFRHRRLDRPLRTRGRSTTSARSAATAPRMTAPSPPWPGCRNQPVALSHLHAAFDPRACQPAGGGPDPGPGSAEAELHDVRRQKPLDDGVAETGRRGGGAARKPVAADNPFLALQTRVSAQITAGLDAYRGRMRDQHVREDVLRLLWLAVRAGAARHQRGQPGAAGARAFVRKTRRATRPGRTDTRPC